MCERYLVSDTRGTNHKALERPRARIKSPSHGLVIVRLLGVLGPAGHIMIWFVLG